MMKTVGKAALLIALIVVAAVQGQPLSHAAGPDSNERHWAFIAPDRPALPAITDSAASDSPIDRFVAARLAERGATVGVPARLETLARRLSYDLIGLPPTFEEIEALVSDESAESIEEVVDRLLASPRFGERWARHWLDVARYADTKGYVFIESREYPHAYTFRDWVVQAFNDDVPYDRFVKLQLAADLLGDESDLPAMGFLTLGRRFLNNQHDIIDDRIDVVTRGLMGLTVSCARCHDHKYDPISTVEYYGLYGVFASSDEPGDEPGALRLVDKQKPVDAYVFERGNPSQRGSLAPRKFLATVSRDEPASLTHGSGRLDLAEAIANRENPLTARVWVNRVWRHLFGEGLVSTPSDFGTRSEPPVHQELLDWLAWDFVEHGWSTKRLIRQIVLSRTYRQSSELSPAGELVDPENRLWRRANRRRLDLEALRDSILFASGQIDLTVGGPAVKLTDPPFPTRRTLYGKIERQNLPPFYRTFDFASPDAHAPKRYETTAPLQGLYMLNSPFMIEQAQALAERIGREEISLKEQAARGYRFVFARRPSPEEAAAGETFLAAGKGPEQFDRLSQFAQALLMTNEFYFID